MSFEPLPVATPNSPQPTDERSAPSQIWEDYTTNLVPGGEPPRRKKLIISIIAIVVATGAVLLIRGPRSGADSPVYQFAKVEYGRIEATVSTSGTVNPVVQVLVGSQVSGNIKALYADFNTHVNEGQLVALIDPAPFEAAVNQAKATLEAAKAAVVTSEANLAKAESDYAGAQANAANQKANVLKASSAVQLAQLANQRQQALLRERIVAQQDADTAQANYDQAVAAKDAAQASLDAAHATAVSAQKQVNASQMQVEQAQAVVRQDEAILAQAQLNLAHTRILAPVDGTVIARNMDVGQTVAASFQAPTIFQIAQDLTKMQVDTNVAEADVAHLEVGQLATFTVDAFPNTVFHGTITQIRKAPINVQNVITYDAVVGVSNPDLKLFPGMTANVTILTERKENIIKVPNAALRFRPSRSEAESSTPERQVGPNWAVAYVMGKSGKLSLIALETGISDARFTEVVDGQLQPGQEIVVGGTAPAGKTGSSTTSGRPGIRGL